MGTFVEAFLNNLLVLLPFIIIHTYERGVKWTFGKNPKELPPGFHWKPWFLGQHIDVMSVADEVIELPIQSVITADEKLVCFSVNVGFRVIDVVKHFCTVQDFRESTTALAMTHMARHVRKHSLGDLVKNLDKMEKSLRGTLSTRFADWGTEVFSVGFTNFAEVPMQVRLFTNGHLFAE